MALYEHSDVFQWGLNLLDGDPAYSPGYNSNIIQKDDNECNNEETDGMITRKLQEEFSQLEIAEYSGYLQGGEQQFHVPDTQPAYDWNSSSMVNYCSEGIIKDVNCFFLVIFD